MVIGVDLGGMSAKAAILTENGLIGKCKVETNSRRSVAETARDIANLCEQCAELAGVDFGQIEAIGIGAPGVIDSQNGTIVSWGNFGWKNAPIARLVWEYTRKRTFVTNDANAAALGEAAYGAGDKYQDSVLITLGTGIGGGIVLGGKLFEGYKSAGAEVGHIVIRQNGEPCTCGRCGCFERYASTSALIRMTKKAMDENPTSKMHEVAKKMGEVNGRIVFEAMKLGDECAKEIFDEYIAALGEGVMDVVNILRPQAIILGGGVSAEGETLLAPLREYVEARSYVPKDYVTLDIVCAKLGNDAGIFGAAEFARQRIS